MPDIHWIKIMTGIFEDEKIKIIQSMPEGDALTILWFKLLTQAGKTNNGGYVCLNENTPYTAQMLSVLFGKSQMLVELAIQTFSNFGMIEIEPNGFIYILNWEKHQNVDQMDKIREQTRKRVQDHRDKKKTLPSSVTSNVTVTQGNATDKELELDLDKEEDKENNKKPSRQKRVFPESSTVYKIAEHLLEKIRTVNPNVKQPDLHKWADEIRKMLELDKRTVDDIRDVFMFMYGEDTFWRTVILSAANFREKFDKINTKRLGSRVNTSSKKYNNNRNAIMDFMGGDLFDEGRSSKISGNDDFLLSDGGMDEGKA